MASSFFWKGFPAEKGKGEQRGPKGTPKRGVSKEACVADTAAENGQGPAGGQGGAASLG